MSTDKDLAFHRKYRPSSLSQYIGNAKLVEMALASLATNVKPQVILLEGASGCGKTTFARLLGMEYNCEDRDTEKGACGVCVSCSEFKEYISTGVTDMMQTTQEIDITKHSGRADLDPILEDMTIPAYGDDWKIYILDEVHEASSQAQNRLLKICEEPPENVLIIFCTTNPEKMIKTLVNRCQMSLKVRKPTVLELSKLLENVCVTEQVKFNTKGLNFIASRADLTIRQALHDLETVINQEGNAFYDSVIKVFEEIADTVIIDFYRNLLPTSSGERDVLGYVTLLHKIKTTADIPVFVRSLIDFTQRGLYVVNNVAIDGVSDGELKTYREIFTQFTTEQIAQLLTILIDLSGENAEIKLLQLGMTGLNTQQPPQTSTSNIPMDTGIHTEENEVIKEQRQANTNRRVVRDENLKKGIEQADKEILPVETSDILGMFGGVEVVD